MTASWLGWSDAGKSLLFLLSILHFALPTILNCEVADIAVFRALVLAFQLGSTQHESYT